MFFDGKIFFFFFIIVIRLEKNLSDDIHWDYGLRGPDVWPELIPQCAGQRQSPVNIRTSCTVQEKFSPLYLSSLHRMKLNFTLKNNGHTIVAEKSDDALYLSGMNLNGIFYFQSFHLHWGDNHRSGSEHQMFVSSHSAQEKDRITDFLLLLFHRNRNGEKYAGECHFVYRNNESEERAVLSFLMQSQLRTNEEQLKMRKDVNPWHEYFDRAQRLIHPNDTDQFNIDLMSLMGTNFDEFWRYEGSLTTPPCDENVQWTIFRHGIVIDDYDFQLFRDDLFYQSYRGPQNLFHRKIYRSFLKENHSSIPDQSCCFNVASPFHSSFFFISIILTHLFNRIFF